MTAFSQGKLSHFVVDFRRKFAKKVVRICRRLATKRKALSDWKNETYADRATNFGQKCIPKWHRELHQFLAYFDRKWLSITRVVASLRQNDTTKKSAIFCFFKFLSNIFTRPSIFFSIFKTISARHYLASKMISLKDWRSDAHQSRGGIWLVF